MIKKIIMWYLSNSKVIPSLPWQSLYPYVDKKQEKMMNFYGSIMRPEKRVGLKKNYMLSLKTLG